MLGFGFVCFILNPNEGLGLRAQDQRLGSVSGFWLSIDGFGV